MGSEGYSQVNFQTTFNQRNQQKLVFAKYVIGLLKLQLFLHLTDFSFQNAFSQNIEKNSL